MNVSPSRIIFALLVASGLRAVSADILVLTGSEVLSDMEVSHCSRTLNQDGRGKLVN